MTLHDLDLSHPPWNYLLHHSTTPPTLDSSEPVKERFQSMVYNYRHSPEYFPFFVIFKGTIFEVDRQLVKEEVRIVAKPIFEHETS